MLDAMHSQNSDRRAPYSQTTSRWSKRWTAAAITTAASAVPGSDSMAPAPITSRRRMKTALITPTICEVPPLACDVAVRVVLALTGKPWKSPAAPFDTPSALISAFGST